MNIINCSLAFKTVDFLFGCSFACWHPSGLVHYRLFSWPEWQPPLFGSLLLLLLISINYHYK